MWGALRRRGSRGGLLLPAVSDVDAEPARIEAGPRVKPEKCQAVARGGQPCSAMPRPGRPFCLWHDPLADEARRELSRKGGRARSHAARARRAIGGVHDLRSVQRRLVQALEKVELGTLSPGQAMAMAALGRAIVTLVEAGEIESRLAALEAAHLEGRSA